MKKIGNILFLYFFVFIMCMGASFAWYAWKGSEVNVNVNFADLDPYIKYTPLTIKDSDKNKTLTESNDYTGGKCYNLTFNKNANGDNLDAYGQNYLKVTSVTNSDIFKASNLKWTLVSVSNSTRTVISTGNFVGETVVEGDDTSKMIPVNIDFSLTKESDNTNYEFYLWLDSNSHQNVDISNENITVSMASNASTIKDIDEMYIRSIEYEVGVIKKFTAYSSKYDITGYKIINTETTPSYSDNDWITISNNEAATIESGKIVTIEPNKTMNTINNICIKDRNNEVYCKSIGKYSDEVDRPTNTLCKSNIIYNGVEQQLVSSTSGTGYTLSGYNQKNAGTYTITATLKDNYSWKDGTSTPSTFDCNISKKDLVVKAKDQTINYGESISQELNMITSTGLVEKDSITSIILTPSTTEFTNNGTITPEVSAIFNNDGDDTMGNYDITYETGKLTINKLSVTCPTIEGYSGKYDGNSHTITVTGGSGGTIKYRTSTTGDWSTTKPTRTAAGTTTVYVQVTGDGNHTTTDCGSKNIYIEPADTSISLSAREATYTGKAINANTATVSPSTGGSITYTYYTDSSCSTVTPTSTGASSAGSAPIDVGDYYVKATVAATTNYKSATSSCVKHTIKKKDVTVSWSNTEFDYDGNSHVPTASASTGISDETMNLSVSGAQKAPGTYTANASCSSVTGNRAKCNNYNLKSTTTNFTINKINPTLTVSATSLSLTYGTNQTFTYTYNGDGEVKCISSNTSYATCSISGNTVTVVPKSVTSSAITIGLYATEGTNYKALGTSSSPNKKVSITVKGITYKATFNKGSGVSAIGSSSLTCTITGSNTSCSVTAPTITSSTGYGTGKWGTSSSTQGSISAGSSITLSSNVTYYAIALAKTYTITYYGNGGSSAQYGTSWSNTATYDSTYTIESNWYTRTGYTFAGWTTISDGTDAGTQDDGYGWTGWSGPWKYDNGQYGISNNTLKLYARWTPNNYTVTFNANGGTGTMSNKKMTYGTASNLTSNAFKKQYTVTYNYDNATSGNSVSSATATYNFVGWTMGGPNLYSKLNLSNTHFSVDDDGMYYLNRNNTSTSTQYVNFFFNTRDDIISGKDYTEISVIKSLTYSGDMNYYVGDSPNASGTITQVSDGVKSVSDLIVGNNYFSLTGTSITNPSYLSRGFVGIPAGASLNIKFRPILIASKYNNIDMYYYDKASAKNLTSVANGTVNLYADWNEMPVTLPTPTKNGYTFKGWYTSASGGTKVGDGGDSYIPTSNTTLYARWEDTTPPTLTLSHSNGVITITSDTSNLYSNFSPYGNTHDSNGNGITNETTITDVSSSEPGPVSDSITWKLETSGSDNPQWIGWQGKFGNIFNGNANDLIIISGYYKSSQLNDISKIVSSSLYQSDWSSYSTTTIEKQEDMLEDGQWHYFYQIFRVNESFSNAIIGGAPSFGYSSKKRTLYINGLNWRIVPSSNTTATDIHIRKWASGSQSLSYFQNGGGTQISGNSFQITSPGTYTVYVEDVAGNGTIKTIDVYSISYDLDGGSVSGNPSYYDKTTSTISINNPTKSGSSFLGWYGSNDTSSGLGGYTSSNTYTASGRDHILGNDFNVSEGEKFRVFVTAKRTSGSLDIQGGIWYTEQSSGSSYDGYGGSFSVFETLSNGYAKYYKDITIPSGKTKGKFYIQIDQDASGGDTTWLLYDMHAIKLGSNPTIPKGSTGNKSYTANWLTTSNLSITKGTGVSTIYYKVNGASSYTSSTSNVSVSVTSGTTYYYYGTASTGYTMNSCTSSSPCSGTMGTSSVTKSLSATINYYTLTIKGYASVGWGYYKINGASSYTSFEAYSNTITLSVKYGTTYYYYATPSFDDTFYMAKCFESSPCSGTMGASDATVELYAEVKSNNTLSVSARSLTYNGSAQSLVTASSAQGTVYYAVGTQLTSSNYSSSGSTTIPTRTNAGSYTVYYYTPGNTYYKPKSGSVNVTIGGIYPTTNLTISANDSSSSYTINSSSASYRCTSAGCSSCSGSSCYSFSDSDWVTSTNFSWTTSNASSVRFAWNSAENYTNFNSSIDNYETKGTSGSRAINSGGLRLIQITTYGTSASGGNSNTINVYFAWGNSGWYSDSNGYYYYGRSGVALKGSTSSGDVSAYKLASSGSDYNWWSFDTSGKLIYGYQNSDLSLFWAGPNTSTYDYSTTSAGTMWVIYYSRASIKAQYGTSYDRLGMVQSTSTSTSPKVYYISGKNTGSGSYVACRYFKTDGSENTTCP